MMARRQGGQQADKGDLVSAIAQPPRQLERYETTERISTQKNRDLPAVAFSRHDVLICHFLNGAMWTVAPIQAARLHPNHRPRPAILRQILNNSSHPRPPVDEETAGVPCPVLEDDERAISSGRILLSLEQNAANVGA